MYKMGLALKTYNGSYAIKPNQTNATLWVYKFFLFPSVVFMLVYDGYTNIGTCFAGTDLLLSKINNFQTNLFDNTRESLKGHSGSECTVE